MSSYPKKAGTKEGTKWTSEGTGSYTIDDCDKDDRGTDIVIYLSDEKKDYLEEWNVKKIVKQFSDFIEYPVVMDLIREEVPKDKDGKEKEGAEKVTTIEEQTLNSMKAIWMRPKSQVKEEEYKEFYKHISHDYTDPLRTIHYSAEGTIEFNALIFLPSKAPFDMFSKEDKKGIHLYVKRIYIMDDCEGLTPEYLRFVKGVVESGDLPLNISREILQDNALIKKIQKNVTGKVLGTLKEMKEKKPDDYLSFYKEFGRVFKEGMHFDHGNKEKIQELLMFESSKTDSGKLITLKEYLNRMSSEQKEIYYLTGDNREVVNHSPHLEMFKEKDIEVLFLTDPIDEWVTQSLTEYDGKKLKAIDRGDLNLDSEKDDAKEGDKEKEKTPKKYEAIFKFIKEKLKDQVKEVKLSNRLTNTACCLVADEFGMSAHMERVFKAMNQDSPPSLRVLELNPKHPIMQVIINLHKKDKKSKKLENYISILYDLALLGEGSPVKNPLRLNHLVSELMVTEGKELVKKK